MTEWELGVDFIDLKKYLSRSFPEYAYTEQILDGRLSEKDFLGSILTFTDAGIELWIAGWEVQTLPLCYAPPSPEILNS